MTTYYQASNANSTAHIGQEYTQTTLPRTMSEADDKPEPLSTSKLGNKVPPSGSCTKPRSLIGNLLPSNSGNNPAIDGLLAKISEQQASMKPAYTIREPVNSVKYLGSSSSDSISPSPASEHSTGPPSIESFAGTFSNDEVCKLKRQLAEAERRMAQMDQELTHSRKLQNSEIRSGVPSSSRAHENQRSNTDPGAENMKTLQHTLATSTLGPPDDTVSQPIGPAAPSETYNYMSDSFNRAGNIWGQRHAFGTTDPVVNNLQDAAAGNAKIWNINPMRPIGSLPVRSGNSASGRGSFRPAFSAEAVNTPMSPLGPVPVRAGQPVFLNEAQQQGSSGDFVVRRNNFTPRAGSAYELPVSQWNPLQPTMAGQFSGRGASRSSTPLPLATMMPSGASSNNAMQQMPLYGRSSVTRLSPTASEFSIDAYGNPWNSHASSDASGPTYIAPIEPLNYRRLLDRNASCDWSYIVDKIVCSNDQQASIFLQQKLKNATQEHKYEIVQAIINQAYPLMVNRFGNFLVQRCFEHGSAEQIITIADAIRGKTLQLSMDAFGCHVIQKAFDAVPENYKAIMVHELLRQIPETVVHRYACHVWQKLFELRWSDSPPQIMKYVNEALCGMWHEVAMGETGSLVVQNIFENCLDEDKRPCINEVLANIDIISHGQFGNWCVQHICEHGSPADKACAIDHILRYATEYSMDQYASKVIEKCLKIGGDDFLHRYLDRVCEARPDRPRMPLIDIAGDQFGNYLVQWILTHASLVNREAVATHVRKHMVSLRGSKYGSRVAMLCNNPLSATRPGPPAGMSLHRFNHGSGNGSNSMLNGVNVRQNYSNYR